MLKQIIENLRYCASDTFDCDKCTDGKGAGCAKNLKIKAAGTLEHYLEKEIDEGWRIADEEIPPENDDADFYLVFCSGKVGGVRLFWQYRGRRMGPRRREMDALLAYRGRKLEGVCLASDAYCPGGNKSFVAVNRKTAFRDIKKVKEKKQCLKTRDARFRMNAGELARTWVLR